MLNNTYIEQVHTMNNNLHSIYKVCIDTKRGKETLYSPEILYNYHIFKHSQNSVYKRIKFTRTPVSYERACENAIKYINKLIQDEA